ncbi:hypothetical protein HN011_008217 [Eciton burchellii]|nr:hypothetical protein HN011_008217 [Eciton burchellii]
MARDRPVAPRMQRRSQIWIPITSILSALVGARAISCRSRRLRGPARVIPSTEMIHEEFRQACSRCAGRCVIFKADTAESRDFRSTVTPAFSSLSTDNFPSERWRNESPATSCQRKLHLASRHVSTHLALERFPRGPFRIPGGGRPALLSCGIITVLLFRKRTPPKSEDCAERIPGVRATTENQRAGVSTSTLRHEETRE